MNKKQKASLAAGVLGVLITAACAASSTAFYTPLYRYRMEQQSSQMHFLPIERNGFTYMAESGCNLYYAHGVIPLEEPTVPETCPNTCEETCDTCSSTCWSTCPNTCPNTCWSTCPNTCEETCEPTCWSTCEEPTCWSTCGACPTSPSKCPTYRDCP